MNHNQSADNASWQSVIAGKLRRGSMYLLNRVGILLLFGAFLIVAYQARAWLKYGAWPEFPLSALLPLEGNWPYSGTEWKGAAVIARFLLDVGVAVYASIVGAILWVVSERILVDEAIEEELRKHRERRDSSTTS